MPKGLGRLLPTCVSGNRPHYGCETKRSWRIHHNSSRPQPGKTWRLEQKPTERDSVAVQLSQGEISACCWRNNKRVWMHWTEKEELAGAIPHSRQHCTTELATTSLVTERESSKWMFSIHSCVGCCWRNLYLISSTQRTEVGTSWLTGGRKSGKRQIRMSESMRGMQLWMTPFRTSGLSSLCALPSVLIHWWINESSFIGKWTALRKTDQVCEQGRNHKRAIAPSLKNKREVSSNQTGEQ